LYLMACDEAKLRIFFHQEYKNVTKVIYKHSAIATAELCANWKGLRKIILGQSDEQVNLNMIFENLPNLEDLSCHDECIFTNNGQTYPKMQKIYGGGSLMTPAIDLLDALPNLKCMLGLSGIRFNIELLRKLTSMNIISFHVKLVNDTQDFMATEEVLALFGEIFQKMFSFEMECAAPEFRDFGQAIKDHFEDVDYDIVISEDFKSFHMIKNFPDTWCNFPFDY
jgi:hypothetical protein